MFGWNAKKIEAPVSDEVKQIDAVELTYVKWYSRTGAFSNDYIAQIEAFPNFDDAVAFAESLKAAHKLLRNTRHSLTDVSVSRR